MKTFIFIMGLLVSHLLTGQTVSEVKVKGEIWKKTESENFIVYFKQEAAEEARQILAHAEKSFAYSSDLLGFLPNRKTELFIHENEPKKLPPAINVIISHSNYIDEMEFAVNLHLLEDMFGKKLFKKFPDWFTSGAAAYATYSESVSENFMADNLKEIENLSGIDAKNTGHKIWHFVASTRGKDEISNILNLARILENEKNGISRLMGISYQEFLYSLYDFYKIQS